MSIPYAPINYVRELVSSLGLDVSHAYEDLAFVESNVILIKMGEEGKDLTIYFNTECSDKAVIVDKLSRKGIEIGFDIAWGGTFELQPNDDDTVDVRFFPENK